MARAVNFWCCFIRWILQAEVGPRVAAFDAVWHRDRHVSPAALLLVQILQRKQEEPLEYHSSSLGENTACQRSWRLKFTLTICSSFVILHAHANFVLLRVLWSAARDSGMKCTYSSLAAVQTSYTEVCASAGILSYDRFTAFAIQSFSLISHRGGWSTLLDFIVESWHIECVHEGEVCDMIHVKQGTEQQIRLIF